MAVPVLQGSDHQTTTLGTSTTKNVSLTVHAATDMLVIKHFSYMGDGAGGSGQTNSITGITWNGVSMNFAVRSAGTNDTHEWVNIYYLAAPTTGAHTLAITYGSAGNPYGSDVVAEYWSGANATIGDTAGHYIDTAHTSDSLSLTTTGDGMTTVGIYVAVSSTITPGAGQTTVYEGTDIGGVTHLCASYEAGETTPSATFASAARIAHCAIEIKAGGGGGSPPTLSSITPSSGFANDDVDVTFIGVALVGTNLNGSSPVVNVPAGWTVTNLNVASGFAATFDLTVPALETPGANSITFSTADGTSGGLSFTILSPTPGTAVGGAGNQRGNFVN